MRLTWITMLSALTLAGCASDAQVRQSGPEAVYRSALPTKDMVACLIPSLDEEVSAVSLGGAVRFVAQIVIPDQEFDIVPTSGLVNGHYLYTVNVKQSVDGSVASLFIGQAMLPRYPAAMRAGIEKCL